jgi:hypothetical protein
MKHGSTHQPQAKPYLHRFGPGVLFTFVPDHVTAISIDECSPHLMYLAGRTVQEFRNSAKTFNRFEFHGVPAFGGIDKQGRAFMLIEVTEASWTAWRPAGLMH